MIQFLENFGLGDYVDNDEFIRGIVGAVVSEGKLFNGYYGDGYIVHDFGDLELSVHIHREDENHASILGFDTTSPGDEMWNVRIASPRIQPKNASRLECRCLVKSAVTGKGLAVVNMLNADVLPSFAPEEKMLVQMVGFPVSLHYYNDEDAYSADQEDGPDGKKWLLADGAVFPTGFLNNHSVKKTEKKETDTDDDTDDDSDNYCLIRGTVKALYHGILKFGEEELRTCIRCIINTCFGNLQLIHTYEQVPENERDALKVGSIVNTVCVLVGDPALYEFDKGMLKDEERDYSVLRDIILKGDPERLRPILSNDAEYYAGYNQKLYKGPDEIIERLRFVNEDAKHEFFAHRATITSVDEGENELSYGVGKRCLVIADDEENNYTSIAFLTVNAEGLITRIETTADSRYHFRIDNADDERTIVEAVKTAYTTGIFDGLFPYMTDDYEHHSFWVLEVIRGKEAAEDYYSNKGKSMRAGGSLPEGSIVSIVRAPYRKRPRGLYKNGERISDPSDSELRKDFGKLAVLCKQCVNGETNEILIIPTVTEDGRLAQMLVTDPELFTVAEFDEDDFEFGETVLSNEAVLAILKTALTDCDNETVEKLIEQYADDWDGDDDLMTTTLGLAVEGGNTDYVEAHIDDFDTWDMAYLMNLTDDPEMIETLNDHGIYHDWDYFADFRFAYETVNGTFLSYDPELRKEALEKYLSQNSLTQGQITAILADEEPNDVPDDIDPDDVKYACELLGISLVDGELVPDEPGPMGDYPIDGWEAVDLLERLGYDISFEGEIWKLETNGVYYLK